MKLRSFVLALGLVINSAHALAAPSLVEQEAELKIRDVMSSASVGTDTQICTSLSSPETEKIFSQISIDVQKLNARNKCYEFKVQRTVTIGDRNEQCVMIKRVFKVQMKTDGKPVDPCV